MRTTRPLGWTALAVALVALAGCTGGAPAPDGPTGAAAHRAGATESSAAGPAQAAPSAAPTTSDVIPEQQLLEAFSLTSPQSDADVLTMQRDFQEVVARCMTDKGFEYTPDVPDKITHDSGASPAPGEEEEWAATWGFGISIDTSPLYADATTDRPDPNADYVASLSPAGQQAYHTALEGVPLQPGEDPHASGQENGCYVQAQEAMPQASAPAQPDLVTELWRQVEATTYDRVSTDPRMADAIATLVQCAADAGAVGYDGTPSDNGVVGGFGDGMHPPTYEPWRAYQQVATAWDELNATGDPSPDALARFQQWERDMAAAEYRCNAPVLNLATRIHTEAVRDVVAPHRAELEDLLATWPNG